MSGGKREWFVFWINGRTSKWAHSLAIEWTEPADGQAVSLCGVSPYDHAPDPLTVGFIRAKDETRCAECTAAVERAAAA